MVVTETAEQTVPVGLKLGRCRGHSQNRMGQKERREIEPRGLVRKTLVNQCIQQMRTCSSSSRDAADSVTIRSYLDLYVQGCDWFKEKFEPCSIYHVTAREHFLSFLL